MSLRLPLTNFSSKGSKGSGELQRSRFLLFKCVRRHVRSLSRQYENFLRKQRRPVRAGLRACLVFFVLAFVYVIARHVLLILSAQRSSDGSLIPTDRDSLHFRRLVHMYLNKQRPLQGADLTPCSWLYLEANAYDGRDLDGFFTNANDYFEESLRAEIAPARAFCAVALESDEKHRKKLLAVREQKGLLAHRFDVFPGISALPNLHGASDARNGVVLSDLISEITLPLSESGRNVGRDMIMAVANRQVGSVFVRISGSIPELYHHMDALELSGVLCDRVDRLVLNITQTPRDRSIKMPYSPSSEKFRAKRGVPGLAALAEEWEARINCRTRVFVTNDAGDLVVPLPIGKSGVFYAILAGAPTFDERVSAQTDSWLQAVPNNRVAIYTNVERTGKGLAAAKGRPVIVVSPNQPDLEQQLSLMQSWSHLVRVRETWDRYMKDDPTMKWLALVDDDTLVFPSGMREYLTMFDHRSLVWGGSGELVRIDNGDHGEFAHWLRNLSMAHGASYCYMDGEEVPEALRGVHKEVQVSAVRNGKKTMKRVSHMCGDNFCRRGCPSVPQGAAIVLSRALVEKLRPKIEACEAATSTLCQRCGSQRLYMCVNRYLDDVRTLMTRGICRGPWKLEHRHNFPYALSYHAFTRNGKLGSNTLSVHADMAQLWELGAEYETRGPWECMIPMPQVADLVGCEGQSHYNKDTESCEPFEEFDA